MSPVSILDYTGKVKYVPFWLRSSYYTERISV